MVLIVIYLIAATSLILGLRMASNPATANTGNRIAGVGMAIAILGTVFLYKDADGNILGNKAWIFGALITGTIAGLLAAKKVKMTSMPELVSFFNGMGGGSAALISLLEFSQLLKGVDLKDMFQLHPETDVSVTEQFVTNATAPDSGSLLVIFMGLILGALTFSGSLVACLKLMGKFKDIAFKGQHIINLVLLVICLGLAAYIIFNPLAGNITTLFYACFAVALLYGIFFVMPIGGADMPVVISLLMSLSGIAAASGGFLYDNKFILTGGVLVGAAGIFLTILMCKAMNRSLTNVLIGSFGGGTAQPARDAKDTGIHKSISLSDAAIVMSYANKMLIVPGYGLAVAQAQHVCHELEKLLESKGVEVKYAIHPVAGRMPGHMNVLLAESDVSYDKLLEMEQANDEFLTTDVVLILGANDVVNPTAKTDPASPIYGMPVLEVELAKTVIVVKRSMKPGYAGIENALFFSPKTSMLFGDAKKVLQDLIGEIKNT
ncbi:MAG: NAD(P)(+) transhydrogenase (Re/Si-specific) subunit beta [Niabella sp.]